jgi:hypothetical protein
MPLSAVVGCGTSTGRKVIFAVERNAVTGEVEKRYVSRMQFLGKLRYSGVKGSTVRIKYEVNLEAKRLKCGLHRTRVACRLFQAVHIPILLRSDQQGMSLLSRKRQGW